MANRWPKFWWNGRYFKYHPRHTTTLMYSSKLFPKYSLMFPGIWMNSSETTFLGMILIVGDTYDEINDITGMYIYICIFTHCPWWRRTSFVQTRRNSTVKALKLSFLCIKPSKYDSWASSRIFWERLLIRLPNFRSHLVHYVFSETFSGWNLDNTYTWTLSTMIRM